MKISERKLRILVRKALIENIADVADNIQNISSILLDTYSLAKAPNFIEALKKYAEDKVVGTTSNTVLAAGGVEGGFSAGTAVAAGRAAATGYASGGVAAAGEAAGVVLAPAVLVAIAGFLTTAIFAEGYEAIKAKEQATDSATKTAFKTAIGKIFISGMTTGKKYNLWTDSQLGIAWNAYKKFVSGSSLGPQEIASMVIVHSLATDNDVAQAYNEGRSTQYINAFDFEALLGEYKTLIYNNQIFFRNFISKNANANAKNT